jgi:HK97 gp10 family phage protein
MAASTTKFEITGMAETLEVFRQLTDEIGDKKGNSKVLVPAVKEAMKPVLAMAKMLAPKDTGVLAKSLTISARKPTRNDKKSKYVNEGDTAIAIVTTRKIPKKLKAKFANAHAALLADYSNSAAGSWHRKNTYKNIRSKKKSFYASMGIPYDGRAPANEWGTKTEFGSAHNSAQPFMRPALESRGKEAADLLGQIIFKKIEQYKAKNV